VAVRAGVVELLGQVLGQTPAEFATCWGNASATCRPLRSRAPTFHLWPHHQDELGEQGLPRRRAAGKDRYDADQATEKLLRVASKSEGVAFIP
jgi:hypothetical protein